MKNYLINSELLKTKTTNAYSILNNIKEVLNKIEDETNAAFHEINSHNELSKQSYESIKNEIKNIEKYIDKYKKFGGIITNSSGQRAQLSCNKLNDAQNVKIAVVNKNTAYGGFSGEYVGQVDDIYLAAIQNTVAKLRDSKLADIRVNNNIGAASELKMPFGNTKTYSRKDKIGIEDLFEFGRISLAMQKQYKEMKPEIDKYNEGISKYASEYLSKARPNFLSKFFFNEKIDKMKIDSYDKYINLMVTQANFNYATNGESAVDVALDFSPLGPLKMGTEALAGKNFITGEEYSDGQRGFTLATIGAGSLLGKILSKVRVGAVTKEETAGIAGEKGGVVLSMNGAGNSLGDLVKKITKDIVEENKTSYVKSIADLKSTENFRNSALNHILEGEINRSGMAVGYHYEKFPTSKGKIIEETKSLPNDFGVYTGKVEVDGVIKKAKSSFFPEKWSAQDVVNAINEAYNNKKFVKGSKNTFRGKSASGLKIEMYIDNNGKIISAFPKY